MKTPLITPQSPPHALIQPLPEGYIIARASTAISFHQVTDSPQTQLELTAWMPDRHGFCTFDVSRPDEETEDDFIDENCRDCTFNFATYDELDSTNLEGEVDADGNPAVMIRYQSRCRYNRDAGLHNVSFPCAAGHEGPRADHDDYNGPMPPMAYAVRCSPLSGQVESSLAWMQAVHQHDDGYSLTKVFRSINTSEDHKVCWGVSNSTPYSLPVVVATYIDAKGNADLLPPSDFDLNRILVRRARSVSTPRALVVGPGYDAILAVSAQFHPAAYLLLRGSGMTATNGVIAAGLRRHVVTHDDAEQSTTQGFATDPDADGRIWFLAMANPDQSNSAQALLLAQLSTCTSISPSASAPVAAAVS